MILEAAEDYALKVASYQRVLTASCGVDAARLELAGAKESAAYRALLRAVYGD